MKRSILVLIIFLSVFLCFGYQKAEASTKVNKYLYLNDKSDVKSIYKGQNYQILEFLDKIEYLYQNEIITIEGHLEAIDVSSNSGFLVVNHKLIKVSNGGIEKEIEIDPNIIINKVYFNNHLYLVGKKGTAGIILEYTNDLKEIMHYNYGENNDLEIMDIIKHQNNFYLACTKNAHSVDGQFQNVGNYNDIKTIIIKLNSRMNVEDILYLNNQEINEKPIFFKIQNEKIYFVISSQNKQYYYQVGFDFSDLILQKEGNNCEDILLGYNGEFIEIYYQDGLKLQTTSNLLKFDIDNVVSYNIEDGVLKVWSLINDDIYEYNIEEYHIDYLKEFEVGFDFGNYDFEQNLNHTDVIKIESYFGDIEVYNQTIFQKNVPGTYDLSLLVKRENLENIQLSTKLNIHPYVNITSGGVYKTGLTLYFLGSATLNNEPISNGHVVTLENDYILDIKDQNGNITSYQFSCVDGYYVNEQPTKDVDYYVFKNQECEITTKIPITGTIEEVYLNNQKIEYTQNNNELKFNLKAESVVSINEYLINKIKIDGIWYDINQSISVKTIKDVPKLSILENNSETLNLDIAVEDKDKSLQKLVLKINDEEIINNYFEDNVYSLDNYKNKNIKISLVYYYDLGDNVIRSKEVLVLEGKIKNPKELISIKTNMNTDIENINVLVNTNAFKKLDKINVNEVNITNNYGSNTNYFAIFISLFLTIVVVFVCLYNIIRIKKKKKSNNQIN